MGLGVRTYVHMDSHMPTKIFEIDGLPNFLRYGAPLMARRSSPINTVILRKIVLQNHKGMVNNTKSNKYSIWCKIMKEGKTMYTSVSVHAFVICCAETR